MNKEKITASAIDNDVREITIREGEASKIQEPRPLRIVGNIDAPFRFIDKRNATEAFNKDYSHALVSVTDGSINLVMDECFPDINTEITGVIKIGKVFKDLGINSDKKYAPAELASKFKLLRALFSDRAEHMNITSSLRNLKAKVNQELNRDDDRKGNVKVDFEQTVHSNVPDEFTLNLPLIEGEEPQHILVSVILEANSSHDISCYLESIDAAEMIDQVKENRVMEEVEKIEPFTTVIFY